MTPTTPAPPARGRPRSTEGERAARRLAVSREAVRLFVAQGTVATSGAEIAAAAGVSERTLWRLFRTKESCVEPVLSALVDGVRSVLAEWPAGADLGEHLLTASASRFDDDAAAALAVVRLSHDEPGLRAVWLLLQERTEPVLAAEIAERTHQSADAPGVRVRAAVLNAALRLLADGVALADPDSRPDRLLDVVREVLAGDLTSAWPPAAPPPSTPAGR